MGMFDRIQGIIKCPYCDKKFEIELQVKAFSNALKSYKLNEIVHGGPYLDGKYARHEEKCQYCEKPMIPACRLESNVVKSLHAFRSETRHEYDHDVSVEEHKYSELDMRENEIEDLILSRNYREKELIDILLGNFINLGILLIGPQDIDYVSAASNFIDPIFGDKNETWKGGEDFVRCLRRIHGYVKYLNTVTVNIQSNFLTIVRNISIQKLNFTHLEFLNRHHIYKGMSVDDVKLLWEPYINDVKKIVIMFLRKYA